MLLARFTRLTPREREVLDQMVAGETAYQTARDSGVSVKTVYSHRGHIMEKLGVGSIADLARLAMKFRASPDGFRALFEGPLVSMP